MEGLDLGEVDGAEIMLTPLGSVAERALRVPSDLANILPDDILGSFSSVFPRVKIDDGFTMELFGEQVSPAEAIVRVAVYCACWGFSISTRPLRDIDDSSNL